MTAFLTAALVVPTSRSKSGQKLSQSSFLGSGVAAPNDAPVQPVALAAGFAETGLLGSCGVTAAFGFAGDELLAAATAVGATVRATPNDVIVVDGAGMRGVGAAWLVNLKTEIASVSRWA